MRVLYIFTKKFFIESLETFEKMENPYLWIMKALQLLCFLLFAFSVQAQTPNRPVPSIVPGYEFEMIDSSFSGHFLAGMTSMTNGQALKLICAFDKEGYLEWFSGSPFNMTDFKYHPQFNQYTYTTYYQAQNTLVHIRLDSAFNSIDTLFIPQDYNTDVHEFLLLPNGNKTVVASKDTIVDLSGYTFGGIPGDTVANLYYNCILEFDPAGNIVFEWKGIDDVDPSEYIAGIGYYDLARFDYMHMNAIDVDDDGNYLVSIRHCCSVYKINRTTGDVMWQFGGNATDFTLTNDFGFSANHYIQSHGNGVYSIFDNGNLNGSPKQSRGVKYQLDEQAMTATRIWEYKHTPLVYANAMGNFDLMPDSNQLIGWGRSLRPDPTFTIANNSGDAMANMYFEDNYISYRVAVGELSTPINRPVITCSEQGGVTTLTAPLSSYYMWSTGESTQSIVVNATGTYMVWVKEGIGLSGSLPFEVVTLQNACSTVDLEEVGQRERQLEYVYDVLGRQVDQPVEGRLYLLLYSDGSIEKVVWTSRN